MIKNVWIAPEIEENVFLQYKNLPFLQPAETQTKRITMLLSHNQLGWAFSCSQTRQKPITIQTCDHFTTQPSRDFVSLIPLTYTEQEFSAAFLKCSRITSLVFQWTRSGNWCSWKQTHFPTGGFQVVGSLCSTVDAWGRWKKIKIRNRIRKQVRGVVQAELLPAAAPAPGTRLSLSSYCMNCRNHNFQRLPGIFLKHGRRHWSLTAS